jgi:hypothetical protein
MIPGTKATNMTGNLEDQLKSILTYDVCLWLRGYIRALADTACAGFVSWLFCYFFNGLMTADVKVLGMALNIVSRTYPRDGSSFPYAMVILDFKSTLSETGNKTAVPLIQQWALEMMQKKIAHVVVTADSRFTVTTDATIGSGSGALKDHSYITHRVTDMPLEFVKLMLDPVYERHRKEQQQQLLPTKPEPPQTDDEGGIGFITDANASPPPPADQPAPAGDASPGGGGPVRLFGIPNKVFGWGEDANKERAPAPEPAAVAPPPPPPPPEVEVPNKAPQGWLEAGAALLEKLVLRRGRSVYDRYGAKQHVAHHIPLENMDQVPAPVLFALQG